MMHIIAENRIYIYLVVESLFLLAGSTTKETQRMRWTPWMAPYLMDASWEYRRRAMVDRTTRTGGTVEAVVVEEEATDEATG